MKTKIIVRVFIAAVFLIMLIRYYDRGPSRQYSDFRVYHTTAVRFLNGENIYEAEDTAKLTPFKYSPGFAVLISPLGWLPIHAASLVFFTVNFILFVLLFVLSGKFLYLFYDQKLTGWKKFLLYAIPLLAVFRFGLLVLDSGQANLLMAVPALAGLYQIQKNKEWSGGALLAFSVLMKYVTFIFVPYLILRKKWKALLSMLVWAVVYCFSPALFHGFGRATKYLLDWMPFITKTSLDQGSWTDYKNQSVYSWVVRWLLTDSPYKALQYSFSVLNFHDALRVGIGVVLCLYAWALYPAARGKDRQPLMTYAALFAGVALFNPNCWPFNFLVLCLPVMVLTHHLIQSGFRDRWTFLFCAVSIILLNIGSQSIANDELQYASEVQSFMTIGGLIIYFLAVRCSATSRTCLEAKGLGI